MKQGKIRNLTNGKYVANVLKVCRTPLSLAKGLMFSTRKKDFACVLEFDKSKQISLHMFFVFYPIDVIFLDKNKKVVEIKKNFKPFTFYNAKKIASYAVEVLEGSVEKTGTKIGDRLSWD
jgi:uncharacterized protein